VRELAKDTVAAIAVEGVKANSESTGTGGDKLKLATELSRGRGISDLLTHAKGERGIRVDVDKLDRHPELMAARNGTVDLVTGKLRESRPADLLTRCAGTDYDPHASAPTFHKFLLEIQPDAEVRAYLQRLIGCAAIGAVREHILPIWWGPGANGKSVLADVVMHAFGDLATVGPASLVDRSGSKHEAHPADLMTCFGRRLVVVHETRKRAEVDAAKVKLLTGGDRVPARGMGKDWIKFAPTHSLLLLSNFKPSADARDGGLWRRLQVVPFSVVIAEEKQDRTLAERIKADEAAGVLRWVVEGAAAYLAKGLHPPAEVIEQTAAYRTASDSFEEFLSECAVAGKAYTVRGGALIERHRAWCELRGFEAMRGNEIADELQARGFERKLKGGRVTYAGLQLRTDDVEGSA
jgi:putative DNA primase/helicase